MAGWSSGAWGWIKGHWPVWALTGLTLVAVALLFRVALDWDSSLVWETTRIVGFVVLAVVVLCISAHFVWAFTRNLPSPSDCENLSSRLRTIFIYAYVVQGLAIVLAFLPFAPLVHGHTSNGSWAGIVHGCQDSAEGYGSELIRCGTHPGDQQWLVHIGSSFRAMIPDEDSVATAIGSACDDQNYEAALALAVRRFEGMSALRPAELMSTFCNGFPENRREHIRSRLHDAVPERVRRVLSRGLVVPLYVVVLAAVGAAVGMTRRLPEIQRRAANSVQHSGEGITSIVARERIVFQIMQVLAAPLIAITAFAALEPDTVAGAVLLGFTSGFASEAVLMKLRQASEAVTRSRPD